MTFEEFNQKNAKVIEKFKEIVLNDGYKCENELKDVDVLQLQLGKKGGQIYYKEGIFDALSGYIPAHIAFEPSQKKLNFYDDNKKRYHFEGWYVGLWDLYEVYFDPFKNKFVQYVYNYNPRTKIKSLVMVAIRSV